MKKVKLFLCLFFVAVAMLSCGDEEVPPQPASSCKLTSHTNDATANITYNDDKISKVAFVDDGYVTVEYNSAGKPIKMNQYTDLNVLEAYNTIDHVSSTLITFKRFEKNASGIFVETISNGRYEFDAVGNLTKIQDDSSYERYVYNAQNNPTASYTKQGNAPEYKSREFSNYDDKKNIARENFVFMALEVGLDIYGMNNPKTIVFFDPDGDVDDSVSIAYEYNTQGYVTKMSDATGAFPDIITFQYACQ